MQTFYELANALRDGNDPIQASPTEIVDALKASYEDVEDAERAYDKDAWAFCEKLEIDLGLR
jgi:hypothetical protein